jgi:hypothetical protein
MYSTVLGKILVPFVVHVFFVVAIVGVALGASLIVASARMQAIFATGNRWISGREATKWLTVPRDVGQAAHRNRRWVGLAFAIAGAVLLYTLMVRFGSAEFAAALKLARPSLYVLWALGALKWFLILGCSSAIVIGILLIFFPGVLGAIETRTDRWVSTRQWVEGGDVMRMSLDNLVLRTPRIAGLIMLLGSAFVGVASGILIFSRL